MNISYLFAALGGAILLWFLLLRQLMEKPWVEKGPIEWEENAAPTLPAASVGLWMFLAVVTSLFGLLFITYAERSGYADWRPLPEPGVLWINTGFLILGSIALQRASGALKREYFDGVRLNLTAGGVFTIVFILGQLWAWRELASMGYFLATNPAHSFFYLLTAVHGLHLVGGLWVWTKTTATVWRGLEANDVTEVAHLRLVVRLCSFYWHYLLVLWLVLFYLLLTT